MLAASVSPAHRDLIGDHGRGVTPTLVPAHVQARPRCGVEPSEHVALPAVGQWGGTVAPRGQGL